MFFPLQVLKRALRPITFFVLLNVFSNPLFASGLKPDSTKEKIYRATATRINDLVDTKLDVRFDYARHFLYGKAWIVLNPHFYDTDSLTLDAKGMDLKEVNLVDKGHSFKLNYSYDSLKISIHLPRKMQHSETYTVYISYTAKPDLLKSGGSAAINSDKGLYFINSDGKDKEKPIQIWTQGESESSSCWFPTIDKPNQKTTEEISLTVPSKYVTLSNGKLIDKKANSDGTRTDTWKMDLPHAPYLFMMAVGDFIITKDKWRNKEVSYYLEPKYAPYARQIFGKTPEMIEFYSKTLGIDYPWNKYSQIVVRDYVSGAMENTTATLHGESVQRTARELLDDNQEDYIAHELFHQWFGDYVTCESWSNLTVNESFAAFSEILWSEHKYGKEKGDQDRLEKLHDYLASFQDGKSPELVRFYYKSREDVFDLVSYNKGALILYMLRDYVGKDAFYKGLHLYLTKHAFKTAEAQDLRIALTEASGKDLTQFFNQWYYKGGHPVITWSSKFDKTSNTLKLTFNQIQDKSIQTFEFPLDIDIYSAGIATRKRVLINERSQTFTFKSLIKPELVNPDPEHILVAEIIPIEKSIEQYAYQYKHAKNYIDRFQSLDTCLKAQEQATAFDVLQKGLKDRNSKLRTLACEELKIETPISNETSRIIVKIAQNDPSTLARAAAIEYLARKTDKAYESLFIKGLTSQSLAVAGASLKGLAAINPESALLEAKKLDKENATKILDAIGSLYVKGGLDEHSAFYEHAFSLGAEKFSAVFRSYLEFLVESRNTEVVQKGVKLIRSRIEGLHNIQYTQAVSQSFLSMAEAKTSMASSAFDPKMKEEFKKQAIILRDNGNTMRK